MFVRPTFYIFALYIFTFDCVYFFRPYHYWARFQFGYRVRIYFCELELFSRRNFRFGYDFTRYMLFYLCCMLLISFNVHTHGQQCVISFTFPGQLQYIHMCVFFSSCLKLLNYAFESSERVFPVYLLFWYRKVILVANTPIKHSFAIEKKKKYVNTF